mmetsp:Transcript_379/g.969  ORF Transcript_379/g.969 Transcript_379/m.969 type:complete len:296 (-) Transcript_379:681-1568(-)
MLPPDEGQGPAGSLGQVRGEVPPVHVQVRDRSHLRLHLPMRQDQARCERAHARVRGEPREQQDGRAERQGHGAADVVLCQVGPQAQGNLSQAPRAPFRDVGDEAAVTFAAHLGLCEAEAAGPPAVQRGPLLHGVEGARRDEHAVPGKHHVVVREARAGCAGGSLPANGRPLPHAPEGVQRPKRVQHHGLHGAHGPPARPGTPLPGRGPPCLGAGHQQVLLPGPLERPVVSHKAQTPPGRALYALVPETVWRAGRQGLAPKYRQRRVELRPDALQPLRVCHGVALRDGGAESGHIL